MRFIELTLNEIVEAMTKKLAPFETWKERLVQDDAILGGEPVFPRSRLAVRKIGSMLLRGGVRCRGEGGLPVPR